MEHERAQWGIAINIARFRPSRGNDYSQARWLRIVLLRDVKVPAVTPSAFFNSRAMTTVGSSGFGKCGELAIVGKDCLSIAFCAKGILVKIASSLRQLWHQLWEYPGGKSFIRTLFPLFSSVRNRRVRQA